MVVSTTLRKSRKSPLFWLYNLWGLHICEHTKPQCNAIENVSSAAADKKKVCLHSSEAAVAMAVGKLVWHYSTWLDNGNCYLSWPWSSFYLPMWSFPEIASTSLVRREVSQFVATSHGAKPMPPIDSTLNSGRQLQTANANRQTDRLLWQWLRALICAQPLLIRRIAIWRWFGRCRSMALSLHLEQRCGLPPVSHYIMSAPN